MMVIKRAWPATTAALECEVASCAQSVAGNRALPCRAAPHQPARHAGRQLPGDQIVETAGIALTYLTKGSPGITSDVLE